MNFDDLKGRPSPEKWNQLLDRLAAMRVASGPGIRVYQGPQGQVVSALQARRRPADRTVPFEVTGPTKEEDAWHVTVGEGYVVERYFINDTEEPLPEDPEAPDIEAPEAQPEDITPNVIYHQASNHREPIPEGEPPETVMPLQKFTVEVGDAICIKVAVNRLGQVGVEAEEGGEGDPPEAVEIVIVKEDEIEDNHFEPAIGDDGEGSPGTYFYILAVIAEDDERITIEPRMTGQNIDHWLDLPTFVNAGGNTIWKEWKADEGKYYTKGIAQTGQVKVTPQLNQIEIRGNEKNLAVEFIESGETAGIEGEELDFLDGLNNISQALDLDGDPLRVTLPKYIAGDGITITPLGDRLYEVEAGEGDGKDLNLTIRRISVQEDTGNSNALRLSGMDPIETDPPVFYWRKGAFVGTSNPDGAGGPPVGLIEKEVTYLDVAP
jgi:hypothetical protein